MRTTSIIRVIICFPLLVFGQDELTQKQISEDYTVVKNILTEGYPSLYEYTSPSDWDSLFSNVENKQLAKLKTSKDLYKTITELTDHARDGHLIVMRPQLKTIPKLFPLLVKIIDKKFYTDTNDFGIPVGSELIAIDQVDAKDIRQRLLKYAPSDGFNTTKKDRQIEREFSILHFYEFGAGDAYQVVYKTPSNELFTKNIESQPFQQIGSRFVERNSYFSNYHHATNKSEFVKNTLGKKEPYVYFIDSVNTAVLTMNSFQLDVEKFQKELKTIFNNINRKKVDNLIVDIRQNEGGYPLNSIQAFSYIANEAFKQRTATVVTTSNLPEESHSQNLVNGYTYHSFFEKYYQKAAKKDNQWISTTDENESMMLPNKKGFKGKTYVLVGGKTFSAGASFALFCKNQGISLIGEETGGNYYKQTGGYPVIYTLPNSKIKLLISFVQIERYVKDHTVEKGSGILPDIEILLTKQDLIDGKDSVLDEALRLIKED
ncbi:S41 family peptidase [Nonlabens xiamenensis]|uniref:S41 family peptidase n=1 Tax=Nonlabens xiamenensis TaxID=2341043 RepID=UPI000F615DC6|nr:S41 family peptidase [Nonlabens xiamenensis]